MKQSEVTVQYLKSMGWTASLADLFRAAAAIRRGYEIRVFSEPTKDILVVRPGYRLERENK